MPGLSDRSLLAQYKRLTNERFVDELTTKAGVVLQAEERAVLIDKLSNAR